MNRIRIEDLSIGDWVVLENQPFKVIGINPPYVDLLGNGNRLRLSDIDNDNLSPIRLTPEILEKNGFDAYGNEYYMYDDGKKHRVYISNRNKYWKFEHCEFGIGCVFNDMMCELLHTHQLQHALRLAGVGKEIEL